MCSSLGNSSWSRGEGGKVAWEDSDGVGEDERLFNCSVNGAGGVGVVMKGSVGGGVGGLQYTPLWKDVEGSVRWVFLLHNYGFACLFFFLAFYAFFSILNLRSQISTRPYMSTINSFLCLLGVSRAARLFIDPYGMVHTMPVFVGTLVWDLGFPCLISSFSLIQIAFLQLTQLDIGPEKLRKKTCLSVVITLHFVTVIASAIYSTFNHDLMVKLVTQLVFAVWGLVLCGSFLYAGKKVLGAMANPSTSTNSSGQPPAVKPEKGIMAMGMGMGLLGPGQNIAASLTAALAPTLLHAATPRIKITDENDRTVSVASDSSRVHENAEAGAGGSGRPLTPLPGSSKSKSIVGGNDTSSTETPGGATYVRPPSPVLPRRKSSGPNLRGGAGSPPVAITPQALSSRRISLNRRGSGYVDEKEACRKKSLTWSESEMTAGGIGGKGKLKKSKLAKGNKTAGSGSSGSNGSNALDPNTSDSAGESGKRRSSGKGVDTVSEGALGGGTDTGTTETLLGSGGPDYTLQSILSHIAYVNQTALDYRLSRKLSRKNQVEKVIKFTWMTAMLGVLLCAAELVRILSPYGLLASAEHSPSLWPWFALHTVARTIEFAMGATVANITKQPVSRPHHYAYSIRHKAHRESLYL